MHFPSNDQAQGPPLPETDDHGRWAANRPATTIQTAGGAPPERGVRNTNEADAKTAWPITRDPHPAPPDRFRWGVRRPLAGDSMQALGDRARTTPHRRSRVGVPRRAIEDPMMRFWAGPTSASAPRYPRAANPKTGNEIKMPTTPMAITIIVRIRTVLPPTRVFMGSIQGCFQRSSASERSALGRGEPSLQMQPGRSTGVPRKGQFGRPEAMGGPASDSSSWAMGRPES